MEALTYVGYFVAGVAGMFAHFLKKKVKGETLTEITGYFHDNVKSTLLGLFGFAVGYGMLISTDTLNFSSAIAVGYLCDSALNKWEVKAEKAEG